MESPTGTGKTLCLLCASLAYRKYIIDLRDSGTSTRRSSLTPSLTLTSTPASAARHAFYRDVSSPSIQTFPHAAARRPFRRLVGLVLWLRGGP